MYKYTPYFYHSYSEPHLGQHILPSYFYLCHSSPRKTHLYLIYHHSLLTPCVSTTDTAVQIPSIFYHSHSEPHHIGYPTIGVMYYLRTSTTVTAHKKTRFSDLYRQILTPALLSTITVTNLIHMWLPNHR